MKKLVILIAMFMIVGGASAATLITDFSGGLTTVGNDFDENDTTAGWQNQGDAWDATSGNAVSASLFGSGAQFRGIAQKFTDTRTGDYALEINWKQVDADNDLRTRVFVWGFTSANFNVEMDKIAKDPSVGTFVQLLATDQTTGSWDHLATAQDLGDVALDSSTYDYYVIRIASRTVDSGLDSVRVDNVTVGGDAVGDAAVGTVFTIK